MHYCLEIIMPPTDDVKAAVEKILSPFNENNTRAHDFSGRPFHDYYVIGGRWSGHKLNHMDETCAADYVQPKDAFTDNFSFPDVCQLKDLPPELKAARVIVAGRRHTRTEEIEASFMIECSIWNGVTYVNTDWNGNVLDAIKRHGERIQHFQPEYAAILEPKADWLVVTVDCHN